MASPYEDALNTLGQMDQRLVNWQNVEEPQSLALPNESNPTHPGLALSESATTGGALEQGLGLAQRGLEAITPSRDTLYKFAQGLEAAGAVGRGATPLYLQQQHMDLQRQQIANAAEERKQMMALRIQQQKAQEDEQHLNSFMAIDKQFGNDPDQWQQQMELQGRSGNPHARMALAVGDKKMQGEWASLVPLAQTYFPEFAQKYAQDPNSIGKSEMRAVLNNLGEIKKRRALEGANADELGALTTAFNQAQSGGPPMSLGDEERFIELHDAKEKRQLELATLRQKLKDAGKPDQGPSPPRNDALDFPAIAVAGLPFASIPRDAVVTQEHLNRARSSGFDTSQIQLGMPLQSGLLKIGLQQSGKLAEQTQFSGGMGRGDVPVGTEANKFTKLLPDGTAQSIDDPMVGHIEAAKQGYRDTAAFKENLDRADKARLALRQLGDLETYAKEIVTAQGGPIETTLQGWKLGLSGVSRTGALTNLTAPNGKRLTVGEVAALYEDKSSQIADQLARGGGMVGVATELDTMKSLRGLAGRYETAAMASEKFRTFKSSFGNNLLQEYDRAYGRNNVPATLRQKLQKGELPTQSKIPARKFLEQQEKAYRDQGFQDAEIRDLLKRDFRDMGY